MPNNESTYAVLGKVNSEFKELDGALIVQPSSGKRNDREQLENIILVNEKQEKENSSYEISSFGIFCIFILFSWFVAISFYKLVYKNLKG